MQLFTYRRSGVELQYLCRRCQPSAFRPVPRKCPCRLFCCTQLFLRNIRNRVMDLVLLGNRALQMAIRRNLVCFPSQAPVFGKLPRRDLQWRLAVLYFIRGWSTREIARRYGLTRERCGQIISDWRVRAVNMGYIQDVTPSGLEDKALELFVREVRLELARPEFAAKFGD